MFSEKLTKYYSQPPRLSIFYFIRLNLENISIFYFNLLFFYSTSCLFFITFLSPFHTSFRIHSFFMHICHNKIVLIFVHLYESKKLSWTFCLDLYINNKFFSIFTYLFHDNVENGCYNFVTGFTFSCQSVKQFKCCGDFFHFVLCYIKK